MRITWNFGVNAVFFLLFIAYKMSFHFRVCRAWLRLDEFIYIHRDKIREEIVIVRTAPVRNYTCTHMHKCRLQQNQWICRPCCFAFKNFNMLCFFVSPCFNFIRIEWSSTNKAKQRKPKQIVMWTTVNWINIEYSSLWTVWISKYALLIRLKIKNATKYAISLKIVSF